MRRGLPGVRRCRRARASIALRSGRRYRPRAGPPARTSDVPARGSPRRYLHLSRLGPPAQRSAAQGAANSRRPVWRRVGIYFSREDSAPVSSASRWMASSATPPRRPPLSCEISFSTLSSPRRRRPRRLGRTIARHTGNSGRRGDDKRGFGNSHPDHPSPPLGNLQAKWKLRDL